MILSFAKADVIKLVSLTKAATPGPVPYTGPDWESVLGASAKLRHEHGLMLVGDHGVYLMSNAPREEKPSVVYAQECDPTRLAFDDWWNVKNASFGCDDGAEFLSITAVEEWIAASGAHLRMRISSSDFMLLTSRMRPAKSREVAK